MHSNSKPGFLQSLVTGGNLTYWSRIPWILSPSQCMFQNIRSETRFPVVTSDCWKLNFLIWYPADHFSLPTNVDCRKPNFLISFPVDHFSLSTNILMHSNPKPRFLQSLVTAGNLTYWSCIPWILSHSQRMFRNIRSETRFPVVTSDCRKLYFLIWYPADHFSLSTNLDCRKPSFLISYPADHFSLSTNVSKHSNGKPNFLISYPAGSLSPSRRMFQNIQSET